MKKNILLFTTILIFFCCVFFVDFDLVNATDKSVCTYINDSKKRTLSLGKGLYAGAMWSKIDHQQFKDAFFNGGDEWDENSTSQAYLQATGICPQSALVIKEDKFGFDDYRIFTGNREEVENWRKNNYPNEKNYEYSQLEGTAANIIARMNQVNNNDHTWYGYNSQKECSYNSGKTKVTIYGNYFEAAKQLGLIGDTEVCPKHIYQYCDAKNTSDCAYSFFPEKQYLCDYEMFICKKIDVNGITIVDKDKPDDGGNESITDKDDIASVKLYIEKKEDGVPQEMNAVVQRKSGAISTTLSMSDNKKAALVGNEVSKKWLNSFLNKETDFTTVYCLTYDAFVNERNEKYTYSTNFSGGSLNNYQYVCALKVEESIVWTQSLTASHKYSINMLDDMELFDYYNRLESTNKFEDCSGLESEARRECLAAQESLYQDSLKAYNSCKKVMANLNYKCDKANSVNECMDDCCVCEHLNKKIEDYAQTGYFGNRIITDGGSADCDDTLGSLGVWLTRIYKILLLAVPVVIVVFGLKDFIQAFTSGKDDELKKSGSTFIKRLILGAIFVALPMLIKVILTVALGGDIANICIL